MVNKSNLNREMGLEIVKSHSNFVPFAFTQLFPGNDDQFVETPFDHIINWALDRTFTGDCNRLIINIPPRHGKTLRAVISYVARGFALNNQACFVHASYSELLVHENSVAIRDVIEGPDYQRIFPHVQFKSDSNSKGLWKTTAGGTFLAAPAGGTITGFGAGRVGQEDRFSGALIIDDPVKPDHAYSNRIMNLINGRWLKVFRSRLAHKKVPVIVIMQRISEDDFTNELLDGTGRSEDWDHLVLPVNIEEGATYQQKGKEIKFNLPPGPLWPNAFSEKQAKELMADIQYSQNPTPSKGEVMQEGWFGRYLARPTDYKSFTIFCDTASKVNDYNDWTVFQCWQETASGKGYLVKRFRDRIQVPFILEKFLEFYRECLAEFDQDSIETYIEDKDSGVGLVQGLQLGGIVPVNPIQRTDGKYARAMMAAPQVAKKKIWIPEGEEGDEVVLECVRFRKDNSHAHDDDVDPLIDFINHIMPKEDAVDPWVVRGMH